ncbi:uncharacterized protein LOC122392897 [Amphibalanus amphitrite]|uniref:uncharacterized protein LOC122392897 n=1 Tax=Amphibalanus amphitrite TaxID=1232801 RepID=UPI001C91A088|nr:uncharacterized protein LOC122392897 [Amphibalanus amphitrite]
MRDTGGVFKLKIVPLTSKLIESCGTSHSEPQDSVPKRNSADRYANKGNRAAGAVPAGVCTVGSFCSEPARSGLRRRRSRRGLACRSSRRRRTAPASALIEAAEPGRRWRHLSSAGLGHSWRRARHLSVRGRRRSTQPAMKKAAKKEGGDAEPAGSPAKEDKKPAKEAAPKKEAAAKEKGGKKGGKK